MGDWEHEAIFSILDGMYAKFCANLLGHSRHYNSAAN